MHAPREDCETVKHKTPMAWYYTVCFTQLIPLNTCLSKWGKLPIYAPWHNTKHNSLLGTERSLLGMRTNSNQKPMICLINLSATLWHHTKSPRMGERVGRKTKQHKISGARSTWKPMRNETRNRYCLIQGGVCCAINPFKNVLVQRG